MRTFPILSLALLLGCGGAPAAVTAVQLDAMVAQRVAGGVRLTNHTGRAIAYAVWNVGWLALFAPCVDDAPACPRLADGASVVVPESEIGGYEAGAREAVVRWWVVVPDGAGGRRADGLRERLLPL